jgi:ribonuclease R
VARQKRAADDLPRARAADEKKLARFAAMCEALGVPFDVEDARDPKKLARSLLKSFAEHPQAHVLNMLLLRAMKQATYDIANVGHFGLASKAYLHFTSPIRRYPDLVVHRACTTSSSASAAHKTRECARVKLGEAALAASSRPSERPWRSSARSSTCTAPS